nr:hypothetical protein [Tanacetum cinerariifolium]
MKVVVVSVGGCATGGRLWLAAKVVEVRWGDGEGADGGKMMEGSGGGGSGFGTCLIGSKRMTMMMLIYYVVVIVVEIHMFEYGFDAAHMVVLLVVAIS